LNEINRLGQISSCFSYILQGIIALITTIYRGVFDSRGNIILALMWVFGIFGNILVKNNKKVARRIYIFTGFTWTIALAIGWCLVLRNFYFILLLILIQWMIMVLFTDKKLCDYVFLLHITVISVMTFAPKVGKIYKVSIAEYFSILLIILLLFWVCVNVINILQNNERRNQNQEKSMDNVMKVLELKCYEAREAAKSKSDFLANMSHEIRTPINSVLGMNEMILRESSETQIREYASNVENSGKMLLSLINDILDFSKIESGKMDLVLVKYSMSSLLNDVCNMIMSRVKEKNLVFVTDISEDIPEYLYGDEVRIKQIVTNLLTNAVKYTETGTVTLSARHTEGDFNNITLEFAVKDTGKGIKPEDRDKLFESFQRVDEVRNRNIEGTGLGLAITSRLVSLMEGSVSVESEYGKGSTFIVSIPQKAVKAEKIGNFKERFKNTSSIKKVYKESFVAPSAKVLIVDDVRVNLLVAKSLLKQTKMQIDTAAGGEAAIAKLKEQQYDVVLLDHMMPGMDGIETLEVIKDEHIADGVTFIALTANAVSGAQKKYLDVGFDDYLSKPIEGKELEKMMIKWLPKDKVKITEK